MPGANLGEESDYCPLQRVSGQTPDCAPVSTFLAEHRATVIIAVGVAVGIFFTAGMGNEGALAVPALAALQFVEVNTNCLPSRV